MSGAKRVRFRGSLKTFSELEEIAAGLGSDANAKAIYRRIKAAGLNEIHADREDEILGPLKKKPRYILLPEGREFSLREMESRYGLSRSSLGKRLCKTGKTEFTLEELKDLATGTAITPAKRTNDSPKVIRNIHDVDYVPTPAEKAMMRL